ncbi:MAG: ATP-grasp fold amidoligase family protein [Porphyromonas somerae]|uniref:ATP-grasp fold amidoligase family protein n=1 Tax=Porphyromonas somerae TaxID=322095 RepID=UPI0026EFFBE5|nr:ATP-grasp fold amidoligase family protein [Porphyromonas somerae]MDD7558572.1 ATP-grasp fold amidoligase family protein [Porphyromonas somerae]MDY5815493.1 ATP-grasp fold amidoligase family protein [Porphyromonas somerae]
MIKRLLQPFRHLLIRLNLPLGLKALHYYYFRTHLNLKDPKTINEKIQWMKVHLYGYSQDPIYTYCADKYRVRDYVKSCDCEKLLNELLAVYNAPEEIQWDKLPKKFALKWNFGNGYNIICHDKERLNIPDVVEQLKKWGKEEPWLKTGEVQYKHAERKIIVEKFIETERGVLPVDYKVYCFYGEPYILFSGEERGLDKHPKFYYYTLDWDFILAIPDNEKERQKALSISKPHHLKEIIESARKLSARFPFVRVDFYDTPDQLYFGELTFTPGGGFDIDEPYDLRMKLGSKLDLSQVNIKP